MLNAGVLALHVPAGPLARYGLGLRRRFVLTKTLEWNLYWAVLDPMWDDDGVFIRPEWLADERALRRRLRVLAALNLAVAPFLLLFLIIYFTMKVRPRCCVRSGTPGCICDMLFRTVSASCRVPAAASKFRQLAALLGGLILTSHRASPFLQPHRTRSASTTPRARWAAAAGLASPSGGCVSSTSCRTTSATGWRRATRLRRATSRSSPRRSSRRCGRRPRW